MKQKKKTGGFTLIEILVCLAISAIVGIFLAGFLGPQINIYHSLDHRADAKSVCNTVFNLVQDHIRNGKNFAYDEATGTISYSIAGLITDTSETISSTSFDSEVAKEYSGRIRISYDLSEINIGKAIVTVQILDKADGEAEYSLTQTVLCRNAAIT